jgi:hypothetical protein
MLDANLSPRRIGGVLRAEGHDVLALSEHPELEGLHDPEVLALAAEQTRILVPATARTSPLCFGSGRKRDAITPDASSSGRSAITSSPRS